MRRKPQKDGGYYGKLQEMKYSIEKLSQKKVLELLLECNNSFTPPLSENIPYTIEQYANRLSSNATFVLCSDDGKTIGFIAFYINEESGFLYIPQIWVSDAYQRRGIGAIMMETLKKRISSTIKAIRLEVRKNNRKAVPFYIKFGFISINDEGNKYLMEKKLP